MRKFQSFQALKYLGSNSIWIYPYSLYYQTSYIIFDYSLIYKAKVFWLSSIITFPLENVYTASAGNRNPRFNTPPPPICFFFFLFAFLATVFFVCVSSVLCSSLNRRCCLLSDPLGSFLNRNAAARLCYRVVRIKKEKKRPFIFNDQLSLVNSSELYTYNIFFLRSLF